jgi:hypothetical protein
MLKSQLKSQIINRNTISALVLAIFIGSIGFVAVYTELFHKKDHQMPFPQLFNNPFSDATIASIHSISIKNKFTEVKIRKENNVWQMIEPKKLITKNELINSLFQDLKTYDIKKIFDKDTINIKSFSLDTPQIEIHLKTNDEEFNLTIGLTNPVNNTTYLMLSNSEYIFQVTALKNDLSSLALTDFVESRLFNKDLNQIASIEYFRPGNSRPFLEAYFKTNEWQDSKSELLNPEKIKILWAEMTKHKAQMILDEIDEEIKSTVEEKMRNFQYSVVIKDLENKSMELKFSSPLSKLGTLKVIKGNSVLVKSDQSPNIYIYDKDILKIFGSATQKLKGLNVGNIFY